MKSKIAFALFICFTSFFAGCKENELDSPYIKVISPVRDQIFPDKDSIRVEAQIEPKNTSVVNSKITIKDKNRRVLASANLGCACENMPVVKLTRSFLFSVKKKQDVTLEICADLANGESICETVPFVITK